MNLPPRMPSRRRDHGAAPKAAIIGVCVVALAISATIIFRSTTSSVPPPDAGIQIEWFCEGCQAAYKAPASNKMPDCPKCGKLGDRIHTFRCTECNKTFEGFRVRIREGKSLQFKSPKGDWTDNFDALIPITCPECGSPDAIELVSPPPI